MAKKKDLGKVNGMGELVPDLKIGEKVTIANPSKYPSVEKWIGQQGKVDNIGGLVHVKFGKDQFCSFFYDEVKRVKA